MDRNIADQSKERARGTGQITVLTIEHVDRNGCLQMRHIDGPQRSEPQFLVDAAFRKQRNSDARLDQSLLGSHAVYCHNRNIIEPG